eukprot:1143263-Pelagomonas_calceolata.AAC.6
MAQSCSPSAAIAVTCGHAENVCLTFISFKTSEAGCCWKADVAVCLAGWSQATQLPTWDSESELEGLTCT